MQAYNAGFARIYNLRWGHFAQQIAPLIVGYYAATAVGGTNRNVLDLCCGTGQLAARFLGAGYRVVGLDLSEAMLHHARQNAGEHLDSGRATFVQADARDFRLDEQFGLAVSTFDALNHLDGVEALESCFRCVAAVLVGGGSFIFDLNTALGLRQWNGVNVDDSNEEILLITRGIYDGGERAWTGITGFARVEGGLYERFEQAAFNTRFEMAAVRDMLLGAGWQSVHFACAQDLATPIDQPEKEPRVFFVATR